MKENSPLVGPGNRPSAPLSIGVRRGQLAVPQTFGPEIPNALTGPTSGMPDHSVNGIMVEGPGVDIRPPALMGVPTNRMG